MIVSAGIAYNITLYATEIINQSVARSYICLHESISYSYRIKNETNNNPIYFTSEDIIAKVKL